ncbi:hypothetical protein FT663_04257 [Candidozyma haemuli var. vulneris]|uniref:Peptidase S8/S53 domain-containing protein n=1 Tax=Candidozyma haemuli TaxID=45357 RepID=A0A2V1ATQ2_9ASCO|nr:hypothetical protein CXQ85_004167 [[Candida] haemuloni]KAF3987893.1 hypothetical protein FT662_03724 [[Candida] haemuloni var. vulneris]KAF3987919.1 hypothetical protein FT663_04257 [[Candida] haemuloni var. vulneris]PVH20663.1 hypothetical protein CXQ85_004167 [[Candida] haemuloni]
MKLSNLSVSVLVASVATAAVIPLTGESEVVSNLEVQRDVVPRTKRENGPAPLLRVSKPAPSRYIVTYYEDTTVEQRKQDAEWIAGLVEHGVKRDAIPEGDEGEVEFFDFSKFKGYSGYFDEEVLDQIKENPLVKNVEEDEEVDLSGIVSQEDATWGLSRISSRERPSNSSYIYDDKGGKGVTAYIVDSGIEAYKEEFEGRATFGAAFQFPWSQKDFAGHGTHVAGIVGSKTYGVAKQVDLVAVNIATMFGFVLASKIVKGLEFVEQEHKKQVAANIPGFKGSTANLSVGKISARSVTGAANSLIDAGVHLIGAAGNDQEDVCHSTLVQSEALIVGATDINDDRETISNFGPCVDIYAPGTDIRSVWTLFDTRAMTGTSMAAPHVTGLISYFLSLHPDLQSEFNANVTPNDLKKQLINFSTKDVIKDLPEGTPNRLAFNGAHDPHQIWNY